MSTAEKEPPSRPLSPGNLLVHRARDDEDEESLRPLDWKLMARLFRYTNPVAGKRNLLILLTIIRAVQLPALVELSTRLLRGPISEGDTHMLMLGVGVYAVLALLTDGIFHFRQRYALELGEIVVNRLRSEIFERVQRQPMSFFHRVKLGRIISRTTSDVEALRIGIQDVLFVCVIQFGSMLFAAVVMAYRDWVLFLVVVAMAPILWLLNNHFRMRFSRLSRSATDSFSRVTATLAESVGGMRVTQGFVRQEMNLGLFRSLLADHAQYNIALARASAVLTPLLELNSQFFVASLLLLGGWRVFGHQMSMGDLIYFFMFANIFFAPIPTIGTQYQQAQVAMASAERVFKLIDIPPDWTDAENAVALPDPRIQSVEKDRTGALPASLNRHGVRVEFRRVHFGYDPAKPVLHDVSFAAEPGQTIALVGHTGSGKSSIINLVAKFYLPTRGEILIDGHEVRTLTSHSIHRQTGIVQQQNFLFSGTLLDNIRVARPSATDDDVRAAARQLDCLDLLEMLPRGLHTEVGERGAGLSLGQRQLVCFTRALLADPRLVILDEATSSIDAITESRLQKALTELLRGRTSFIVAHRLSTIRHADQVLVLEQGRIIEHGTHLELVARRGHYAALYRQFIQQDERT